MPDATRAIAILIRDFLTVLLLLLLCNPSAGEFAKQFSINSGTQKSALSRMLTSELRNKFEAAVEAQEAAEKAAEAVEAKSRDEDTSSPQKSVRSVDDDDADNPSSGGVVYVCVRDCRVRAGPDLESEEVGSLERGLEVMVLETQEVDALKEQEGREVAEEYKGKKLMRLRIDKPMAGWVSLTMPGGEPQMEAMQQVCKLLLRRQQLCFC